ncbi:hypothetical protein LSH36_677g04033 [Paralvinella palmiformis]|uniref:Uncharacterized protein n=1 Tax=Paralvinella palmiformis TaxID=53620 RepID=A0AAD9J382_9ANNE|nr:hypothetical protein LSH36_677g04033 [Paralvinella palmiformis]
MTGHSPLYYLGLFIQRIPNYHVHTRSELSKLMMPD